MARNYINKNDLLVALRNYNENVRNAKENNLPIPKLPNYVGECIMKISTNIARRPNFRSYTFVDEMISDAIEDIVKGIHNYDPSNDKQNPFGYFTKIAWRAFLRRIDEEKKQLYLKYKTAERFGTIDENELFELDEELVQQMPIYTNLQEFISEYEASIKRKKLKQEEKAKIKMKGIECFYSE